MYGPITGAGYLYLLIPGAVGTYVMARTQRDPMARRAFAVTTLLWIGLFLQLVVPTQILISAGYQVPLGAGGPALLWSGRVALYLVAVAVSTAICIGRVCRRPSAQAADGEATG